MASLTRAEAVARANLLSVRAYRIDLDLTGAADAEGFTSTTSILFSCREPGSDTFVEIRPAMLHDVTLNGAPVDPAGLAENRLGLSGLAAENELRVRATMEYSNTGEGLHRFTDPEDGADYLYAQTFLDDAQRIFACFDQPDLKAPVTLTVSATPDWEVAGNGAGSQVTPGRWEFATTKPLATYFVSFIAGPYHVRRDAHDGIGLAVYCRRSLAPHLDKDADEIFGVTKACFDRYHELFGVRYPFGKYDQAFVPEFNAGAMENVGLVTFRDDYVFRSAVADVEREARASTIAHEMAHMWFGDLVTMRWWDDLWLNESFAEYMSYRLTAEVTRFTSAWTGFAVGRKGWGYTADQRPSTHPVAPESVADAGLALLNFDGISYAKGASVLRQLVAWLGDEAFLRGLRAHFAAHAYGNATLDDLLDSLSTASGRDLRHWADVWLRQPQVNTLRPEVTVAPDGRYTSVEVIQTAPKDHPTLRPHRMGIGVYCGGSLVRRLSVDLEPTVDFGRTRIAELEGVESGELLLLNDGDLTYAKIRFDNASRAALPRVLPRLTDSLARALVWAAAADAVRDAEEPASGFVTLFEAGILAETEVTVLDDLLRFTTDVVARFLPPERLPSAEARIARVCLTAMRAAPAGSGLQLVTARGYVSAAGPEDAPGLRAWLSGVDVPPDLKIDADMRWAILTRLAGRGDVTEEEIDAEAARDRTASGAEHAARSRAARPDPAGKARAWRTVLEDDALSNRLVVATAEGFWHPGQVELTRSYVERYFDEMPAMAQRRTQVMTMQLAGPAFPRYAVEPDTIARAERLLARPDVVPSLRRLVVDHTDELRRALAGRTLERH